MGLTKLALTVAVATCGRPDSLRKCLAAIAAQTRPPDQIVVVDQQSSDESRAVATDCAIPVDYLTQPRRGLSASRNLAMENAKCEVLAVTDDDCFADPAWLAAVSAAFSGPEIAAVTGPILPPPGDPPPGMRALSLRPSRETRDFDQRISPWHVGSGANFACRTAILRQIGGWDERLGVGTPGMAAEDCEVIDRLLAAKLVIRYDGGALIHHAWQIQERRRETRWSYGFGIGALAGLRLGRKDWFGWHIFQAYARMNGRSLVTRLVRGELQGAGERATSLASLVPGLAYGLKAARRPARNQLVTVAA